MLQNKNWSMASCETEIHSSLCFIAWWARTGFFKRNLAELFFSIILTIASPGLQIRFGADSVKPKMKGWNRFRRHFGVTRPVSSWKNRNFFGNRKFFSSSVKPKTENFSVFQHNRKPRIFQFAWLIFPFFPPRPIRKLFVPCQLSFFSHNHISRVLLQSEEFDYRFREMKT